jgi:invasion protein IalB
MHGQSVRTIALHACVVTMLVTSGAVAAQDAKTPSAKPAVVSNWQVLESDRNGTVEVMARDEAGAVSAICKQDKCGVFVEPVAGCVPGSSYPLLVNSAKQVGVIASICGVLQSQGADRYMVKIEPQDALFPAMMRGDVISIAFPTQGGEMNVINVSMAGIRPHLERLVPSLGKADKDAGAASVRPTPEQPRAEREPAPAQRLPQPATPDFSASLTRTGLQL